jgi:hypothetical protein
MDVPADVLRDSWVQVPLPALDSHTSPTFVSDTADDRGGDNYDDRGGDNYDDSLNNKTGQEKSTGNVSESDTSDTSDSDKKCNGDEEIVPEVISSKTKFPSVATDKEIKSDVTHVTHVTPTRTDTTANLSHESTTINAESKVIDIAGLLSAKERERCKQSSLTDEQINIFYQVFNELENTSNLHPGSYSSDDKGTIGGGELRGHLVSVGKFTPNDAEWIVKEMQRIGNIKKVALDTFRRVS